MKDIPSFGLSPFDVANWFICHIDREAGDSITHLKLQKLIYYAQSWSLALYKKSLFEAEFQAWAHGPVLPEIYDAYKEYSYESLPHTECSNNISGQAEVVLSEVQRIYGEKSARALENLTHQEDPWLIARGNLSPEARCTNVISKESMIEYYQSLLEENGQE